MAYVATGNLPAEHRKVLVDFSAEELRELPLESRVEFALRAAESKAASREAFWNALATAIPLITALGLMRYFK